MVETFFIIKCATAFVGLILLIVHMAISWRKVTMLGQRMRYITLFGFSVAFVSQSARHVTEGMREIHIDHWIILLVSLHLIVTMIESIREAKRGRVREHY